MMDDFKKKFIEEASDLINKLEETLLSVEKSTDINKTVDDIFRIMHSLKGGGAMFGFEKISEFTHNLENIYDLVRNGKLSLNKELFDLTFSSVDHLMLLLADKSDSDVLVAIQHEDLIKKVNNFYNFSLKVDIKKTEEKEVEISKILVSYFISFEPKSDILYDGTNPLYLIDELCNLGKSRVYVDIVNVPKLDDLDLESCYVRWNIIIVSTEDLSAFQDVFIFVESDSKIIIKKIAEDDLLSNERIINSLDKLIEYKKFVNIDDVLILLQSIKNAEKVGEIDIQKQILKKKFESADSLITSIRVSSDKLDSLLNLVSELVTTQASLSLYSDLSKIPEMTVIAENVENITRQLRDVAFSISLIPIESVVTRFTRLIRDLSAEFKKDILFVTEGVETELDKTLIQNITEPLMHIIRNSVDHGIESMEERIAKNKPSQGRIGLKSYYSGTYVIIEISDDGRGLDVEKIQKSAIKKGFLNPAEKVSEKEILNLIFLPGFSTTDIVTDISGRGVGMDVVKRRIFEVRGDVEIESVKNKGTTIRLKLPLTLSIIDGLLIDIGTQKFILPISVVSKIYSIPVENQIDINKNYIILDDQRFACFNLRKEFSYAQNTSSVQQIIIVNYEDQKVGLVVDQVVGELQAVLKTLGKHYRKIEIVSGATILGDGTIALVLDSNKIIKKFSQKNE